MQPIYKKIKEYCIKHLPNECWGYVLQKGKLLEIMPVENIGNQQRFCVITDPRQYVKAQKNGAVAFFHSHPNGTTELHKFEQAICNELELNSIIYEVQHDNFHTLKPDDTIFPLEGRPFFYGVFDCWTSYRDAAKLKLGLELLDIKAPWGWWLDGQTIFRDNVEKQGYVQVKNLKDGDGLLMKCNSEVENHVAYYENGHVLSHRAGQISFWEKLTRVQKDVSSIWRHESLM